MKIDLCFICFEFDVFDFLSFYSDLGFLILCLYFVVDELIILSYQELVILGF